jgi:hypothetical protein
MRRSFMAISLHDLCLVVIAVTLVLAFLFGFDVTS